MKKYLFTFLLFFILLKSSAQITLEHTLDSVTMGNQFYCTDIGNNEFKYVFLDTTINGFHLYNMDMTPYMTTIIPVVGDSIKQGFTVIYITRTLFDCDSTNIEYAYERANGSVPDAFRIFRTDGTLLLQVDSARGPYCFGCYGGTIDIRPIQNTSDGTKLFVSKRNLQYNTGILIYSVCGTLSTNVYDFSDHKTYVNIFPNPATMKLNFEIILPNNQEEFHLMIFDSNAKEFKNEKILLSHNRYSLDVSNYNNGLYFFSLASKAKVYETGKFTLVK